MSKPTHMVCHNRVAEFPFVFYACSLKQAREKLTKKCEKIGYLHDMNANMWLLPTEHINSYSIRRMTIDKELRVKDGTPHDIFFLEKPFIKKVLYKEYIES